MNHIEISQHVLPHCFTIHIISALGKDCYFMQGVYCVLLQNCPIARRQFWLYVNGKM